MIDSVILTMARSDAAFDGRDFNTLSRADKRRYLERCLAALRAIANDAGVDADEPLREVASVATFDTIITRGLV